MYRAALLLQSGGESSATAEAVPKLPAAGCFRTIGGLFDPRMLICVAFLLFASNKGASWVLRLQRAWDVTDEGPMEDLLGIDLLGIEVEHNDDGSITLYTSASTSRRSSRASCATGLFLRSSATRCLTRTSSRSTSSTR